MKTYRVSVGKIIDDDLGSWFDGCRFERKDSATFIYFEAPDQARLFGIIKLINDLGLPLGEVEIISE